jgi:hypothetical protein
MHKEEQRFVIRYFWTKSWGSKQIHEELITTLGDDAYHLSQIKIWLQRFKMMICPARIILAPGGQS